VRRALAALAAALGGIASAAVDIDALWDYAQPAASEQRFRDALASVQGDDALVLRTQIARTLGLRQRFAEALQELDTVDSRLGAAGPEPRVRAWLERGRVLRSSGHPREAEPWFRRAFDAAQAAKLEPLAADALHMVALVQPDLAGQVEWNRRTVDYARAAADPRARRWDGPALNNLGVAYNQAGRHAEALAAFEEALAAYRRSGREVNVRIARWMVAHTQRRLGRIDEALAGQRALEAEWAAAGRPSRFVFEELALLYEAKGDSERAARYRAMERQAKGD